MKKIIIICIGALLYGSTLFAQSSLSESDRAKAVSHLERTRAELLAGVKGLSDEQLNFKPSADSWSIAECVEHLAITETSIYSMLEASLETDPDPSLREEVKMSDEQILGFIENRDEKIKTRKEFEPSGRFESYSGSLKEFKNERKAHMAYLKKTDDDLRNRYADLPFGKIDAYQVVLFMSGHTARHIDQIREIKKDPSFPRV